MVAPRLDLAPLREPLGLVRALQWFFSIFCFATCGGFGGSVRVLLSCLGSNHSVSASFSYPFRLNQAVFSPSLRGLCNGTWAEEVHLVGDFSGAAQFFVAVAVLCFLYSLLALATYLSLLQLYRGPAARLPLLDFVATVTFSFLWLLSSSAWAKALSDVKTSTASPVPNCNPPLVSCYHLGVTSLGSLNVSVIFGFLNLLLWLGSSWFVYKETNFHHPSTTSTTSSSTIGHSAPASI
ncbi:LOW QUALITY PROTEIN: synaptophysin-like protein 1 [Melanerpes formicivorus]|uniref:LOW QUALITY PROTEIN: synaptophysin-like protein 1 n=1 Tax=Melanerpes formicivorus TaxID=211600 RepID=UPI00358F86A0